MESRIITITEVNLLEDKILGLDQYNQPVMISNQFQQPLSIVPKKDESWIVKREGMHWFLDRRADDTETITRFSQLSEGDTRIEAKNNLVINATKIMVNGEEAIFPPTIQVKVNDNEVGDVDTINFKSNNDVAFNVAFNEETNEVEVWANGTNAIRYGTELPLRADPGQPYWLTVQGGHSAPYVTGWIGANGTTNAGTVTATLNHVIGDFLLAFVCGDAALSSSTTNTPTGWTKLFEIESGGAATARLACYYLFATANASNITFTSTLGTDTLCLAVAKYHGVSTSDPIHGYNTLSETSAGTAHTLDAPTHWLPKYARVGAWAYGAAGATTMTASSETELVDINQGTTFQGLATTNNITTAIANITAPQTYAFTCTTSTSVTVAGAGLILAPRESTERILMIYDEILDKWVSEAKPYHTTFWSALGDKPSGGAGVWNTELISSMFLPWDIYERQGLTYQFRLIGYNASSGGSDTDLALICETSNFNISSSLVNVGTEFCRLVMSNATTASAHTSAWETIPSGLDLKDSLRVHLRWREETGVVQSVQGYGAYYRLISK